MSESSITGRAGLDAATVLYPIQNEVRNRLDISGIWDFQPDPDGVGLAEGWFNGLPAPRPIAVPGSWNSQYDDLFNYFDLGWYLTRIHIPRSWRGSRIFIRVGSACYTGTVYVNGERAGSHEGGHLPFALEITDLVTWDGPTTVAIAVENRLELTRVPSANMPQGSGFGGFFSGYPSTTFDFFPFAGLHRPVVLFTVPDAYIDDITVTTGIEGADGWVQVDVQVQGDGAAGTVTLTGNGSTVTSDLRFADGAAEARLEVLSARLWSDQDPFLYDLTVAAEDDRYSLKIGIRTIAVSHGEILLNGEPVKLNGFGRHEDFFASGKGLNLPLLIKDYQLMRWTGANSYRTSHYPYSEEEMMLADREGFLIIDEIPAVSLQFDNAENIATRFDICVQQIDELIARDKNHASVVMWSVANEPSPPNMMARYTGGDVDEELAQRSETFLHDLVAYARERDPSRLVTLVGVMGGPIAWLAPCDVVCINRYWGWYVRGGQLDEGLEMINQELDQLWEALGKPIIVTEFGADTQPGLHGNPAVMWTEEYQAALVRGYLRVAADKPFVAGMHVWNFADFAAVQSPMRVGGMNLKGVFTRAREPKMAAHALRDLWVTGASEAPQPAAPQLAAASEAEEAGVDVEESAPGIRDLLDGLARRLDGRDPALNTALQFDFKDQGIYRLVCVDGVCHVEPGAGEATASTRLSWRDARKLFAGKLNPMIAMATGRIKIKGDARAFMMLQDLI